MPPRVPPLAGCSHIALPSLFQFRIMKSFANDTRQSRRKLPPAILSNSTHGTFAIHDPNTSITTARTSRHYSAALGQPCAAVCG